MKLTDSIYIKLRDEIFNAHYKPNDLITERQIAEKYGVSKLTAGEVLHRLCSEGHLTSYPRSGYMVTLLTPREVAQLKKIRLSIEMLALEGVVQEASGEEIRSLRNYISDDFAKGANANELNTAFHLKLAELSKNRFLLSILRDILGSLSRVEQHIPQELLKSWQEPHRRIVDALAERNLPQAVEALKEDLR